jgi:hypothetical protein
VWPTSARTAGKKENTSAGVFLVYASMKVAVCADEGSQARFCTCRLHGPETLSRGRRPAFPSKCATPPRSAEHNAPILCAAGAQHIVLARPRPPIGAVHPSHCIEAQPYTLTCRTLWSPCSRLTASTTSSQEDVTRIPGIWAGKAGR